MANKNAKTSQNVPGKFYVDDQCTACGLCENLAPDHFKLSEDGAYAYVCKQPVTDPEIDTCKEAQESCPVEAIGNDG